MAHQKPLQDDRLRAEQSFGDCSCSLESRSGHKVGSQRPAFDIMIAFSAQSAPILTAKRAPTIRPPTLIGIVPLQRDTYWGAQRAERKSNTVQETKCGIPRQFGSATIGCSALRYHYNELRLVAVPGVIRGGFQRRSSYRRGSFERQDGSESPS